MRRVSERIPHDACHYQRPDSHAASAKKVPAGQKHFSFIFIVGG